MKNVGKAGANNNAKRICGKNWTATTWKKWKSWREYYLCARTRTSKSVKSTRCKVSPLSHYISLEITTSNATRKPISQNSYCEHNIYDIGANSLYFQCFVTTHMLLFCKPTFFSGNCRICRDLAFGSVNHVLKRSYKNWNLQPQHHFFVNVDISMF